jgi:hypothetical protein
MAEKKISQRLREAAGKMTYDPYRDETPSVGYPSVFAEEVATGRLPDRRNIGKKFIDYGAERIVAPLTDQAGRAAAALGMKKGGKVSSASKRADGCCVKGKTRGKMV